MAGLIFWRKKKEDKAQVSEPSVVEPAIETEVVEIETVVETETIEPIQEVSETFIFSLSDFTLKGKSIKLPLPLTITL